jgi:hypothetical protein
MITDHLPKCGKGKPSPNPNGRPKSADLEAIRQLKQEIKDHGAEIVDLKNPKTNKIIKLSRILAMMDMVYTEAMNKKNLDAAKLYLEYTIGAPDQAVDVMSDGRVINFGVVKSPFINPKDDKK